MPFLQCVKFSTSLFPAHKGYYYCSSWRFSVYNTILRGGGHKHRESFHFHTSIGFVFIVCSFFFLLETTVFFLLNFFCIFIRHWGKLEKCSFPLLTTIKTVSMTPEVGRVPRDGLQEMILRTGGTRTRERASGWAYVWQVPAELGPFKEKAQGQWVHVNRWWRAGPTLPGPWVWPLVWQ